VETYGGNDDDEIQRKFELFAFNSEMEFKEGEFFTLLLALFQDRLCLPIRFFIYDYSI